MENKELHQDLIEKVINQIEEDINDGTVEAIEELLKHCPTKILITFLPEEEHEQFKTLNN